MSDIRLSGITLNPVKCCAGIAQPPARLGPFGPEGDRFRPNLGVSGCGVFDEDRWQRICIGTVEVDVVKPCALRHALP